jgi:hypothetical protein
MIVSSDPPKTAASQRTSQRAERAIRRSERQQAEQSNLGSRAAVLSQAGAPLSWTRERADMLFVCERARKAAADERRPQRAERAMYSERGDTLNPTLS